jgi:predicted SnoaL-like aldol condensation-catalyzing enzyme
MVIIHLEALNTLGKQTTKTNVADMYRLFGRCIVRHWDVLQAEASNAINPLTYF